MKIKDILMTRDAMTSKEADSLINDAMIALQEYLAYGDISGAGEVCSEYFGLEPDYIFELL